MQKEWLKYTTMFSLVTGILGSVVLLFGIVAEYYFQDYATMVFFIGSLFLLLTAISSELLFFTLLQAVLLSGFGALLLGFDPLTSVATPLLLSFQVMIYYFMVNKLQDKQLLVGVAGIAILGAGFAAHHYFINALGSGLIAWYSYQMVRRGEEIALIWAIINTLFCLVSAIVAIKFYLT